MSVLSGSTLSAQTCQSENLGSLRYVQENMAGLLHGALGQLLTFKPRVADLTLCDQIRLKLACSAIETSYGLESWDLLSRGIILSRQ